MSGKLEPILPFDELLVQIKASTPATQSNGEGNTIHFVVEDDDSSAKLGASSNGILRTILVPSLDRGSMVVLWGTLTLGAMVAIRRRARRRLMGSTNRGS